MAKLKTGRYPSGLKELRKTKKRTILNVSKKSQLKTITKKVFSAVEAKEKDTAQELLQKVFSLYDKAAKTNTISRNRANRKKSQLSSKVVSL